jgi:hypothetical protein
MLDNGWHMVAGFSRCADAAPSPLWKHHQPRTTDVLNCGPESNNVGYDCSYKPVLPILLRLIFLAFFLSSFAFADAPLEVGWTNGRLSVSAKDIQFSQVLREIGRQTGTEMQGLEMLQGCVSVHLSGVGLAESFQNLLSGLGYALINKPSQGDGTPHLLLVILEERVPRQEEAAKMNANNPSPDLRNRPPLEASLQEPARGVETQQVRDGFPSPMLSSSAQVPPPPVSQRLGAPSASMQRGDQEALRKALLGVDPTVQASAFQTLSAQDKETAIEAVLDAARSDQPATRLGALQLLDNSGAADEQTVLSVLGDALKDGELIIRGYAIHALATRGGDEAMGYLRQALNNRDPSVRAAVISSVAPNNEMRPLLNEALSDTDQSVSSLAVSLLQPAGANGVEQHLRDWR